MNVDFGFSATAICLWEVRVGISNVTLNERRIDL